MKRFYITTPIYYVNDLPHIGHIYSTLVADTVARWRRMAGDEVYFLTGTDEHGQNIERAAAKEGVAPIELADRVVERYHQLWQELGISHDDFIRTTEERHRHGVHELIRRIDAADDFYLAKHEGWYCSPCETFYTDKELGEGNKCPIHDLPTEWQSEENVFFRLSKYQDRLLEWYAQDTPPIWPESRSNEARSFVESGLRDLSVSRSNVSWGIPWPGRDGHTVYVWLDALSNYITALGYGSDDTALYERFWSADDGLSIHLIGKDIIRHHCIYWPAFLMSAGLPLPKRVWAHGFWLRDDRKISKSVGNIVRPDALIEEFGVDSLRFFLLRDMVFGLDASFSDEAFVDRYNSDLANDLGNTVSRVVTLSRRAFDGCAPPQPESEGELAATARRAVADYRAAMDEPAFHKALEALWRLLAEANQYLVAHEPWKLIKEEDERRRLAEVLWNALEATRIVAVGLLPVMPETAPRVLAALGVAEPPRSGEALEWGAGRGGASLPDVGALFPRIDKKAFFAAADDEQAPPAAGSTKASAKEEDVAQQGEISIDRFFETELRVATVIAAEPVPKSSKLLKVVVDLGGETRTVVAGIAKQYEASALVGRQVVIVANLQPAKLMGVESQGMVLAASDDGRPVLLAPDEKVPEGTRVR